MDVGVLVTCLLDFNGRTLVLYGEKKHVESIVSFTSWIHVPPPRSTPVLLLQTASFTRSSELSRRPEGIWDETANNNSIHFFFTLQTTP